MKSEEKSPAKDEKQGKQPPAPEETPLPPEFGGRKGPEATRFGDWELNGKCVDF